MHHPAPRSPSGALAYESCQARMPVVPEYPLVRGLENAINGAAMPVGPLSPRRLRPGVIQAEIILGNTVLLGGFFLQAAPGLSLISGQTLVPALWLINATLAVGLIAAFRGGNPAHDRRLVTAIASLVVASLFDWYVVWIGSTFPQFRALFYPLPFSGPYWYAPSAEIASSLAVAVGFAVPLLALGIGVGSFARLGRAPSGATFLGGPADAGRTLTSGAEALLIEDADKAWTAEAGL